MKQRLLSLLLCGAMLFSMCTPVSAAENQPTPLAEQSTVAYRDCDSGGQNWSEKTVTATEVTANDATNGWGAADGQEHWYVASGTVTIGTTTTAQRVTVTGDVRLILADGCTLTVNGGIHVADDDDVINNGSGNSLTIYGQQNDVGTLIAKVNQGNNQQNGEYAGIGGNKGENGGYTPPSTPTYPPTVERPGEGGGTPSTSPSNPKQGDTVTITPKPDSGYEVDKITVTDRNGKPVEVTKKPDGTYTFKQPSGKVTIEVTYQPIDRPWNNPFTAVSEGDWYYEAVRFVQERGLMNGYSDGPFGPNDPLSRAQLAQILFNKEGRPVVNYQMDFADIAGEAWYAEAVRWAASQGIVGGYGDGRFGPEDPITREQLAVMFWRYSGSPAATNKELHFNDTDEISPFALEALRWAVEHGIINGYGDGRFGPQGQATCAQVAQMLKNFIENQEENT